MLIIQLEPRFASRGNVMIGARLEYQHNTNTYSIVSVFLLKDSPVSVRLQNKVSALCHAPNEVRPAKNCLGDGNEQNDGMVHSKGCLHILAPQRCLPLKAKANYGQDSWSFLIAQELASVCGRESLSS
ncbi:General transcription and DNA repair factor IIH helicase subunit XPD [Fusarium oxysporum f. sp. albedinis]|nr:General transcription and DNA repair factor IIH helicase subunit XPD [Fusarium oxysporum f. sp. albedinis]